MNIAIVWLLTGLWHGASWNFVLWGAYYGLLLIGEKCFLLKLLEPLPLWIRRIATFIAVALGWSVFAFTDFHDMGRFIGGLIGIGTRGGMGTMAQAWVLSFIPWLLLCAFCALPLGARLYQRLSQKPSAGYMRLVACILLLLLCVAALASQSYNPFIYFRF